MRHPENSTLKAPIVRASTADVLARLDADTRLGPITTCGVESGQLFSSSAKRRYISVENLETSEESVQTKEEAKKEDEEVTAQHPISPKLPRRRERSLHCALAFLKPTPLADLSPSSVNFRHGPRKSLAVRSASLSKLQQALLSSKKRNQSATPTAVKELSFTELQQQIAQTDTITKIDESVSALAMTPKKRGRRPRIVPIPSTNTMGHSLQDFMETSKTEAVEKTEEEGEELILEGTLEDIESPTERQMNSIEPEASVLESINSQRLLQQVDPVVLDEFNMEEEVKNMEDVGPPLQAEVLGTIGGEMAGCLRQCCLLGESVEEVNS